MYEIRPQQNRDYVLERIPQEQIMEYYLNVPVQCKEKFRSPLREDKNPSCAFFYSKGGKLYFRDFSKAESLDCFDVASLVLNLDFRGTLRQVIQDFNLNGGTFIPKDYSHLNTEKYLSKVGSAKIEIVPVTDNGKWCMWFEGMRFWDKVGVDMPTLRKYRVVQLQQARVNGVTVYGHKASEPGFAYCFGDDKFKLYFPLSTGNRFIQNTDAIQGLEQLPESGDLLVVTKSMKDVMLFHDYGVPAVAPQSESFTFDDAVVEDWHKRFKRVVIVYDYDYTGVRFANKWRKKYGWEYAFVEGAKDISDLYVASPYHCEQWINKLRNG
jgi:hypothetical protein